MNTSKAKPLVIGSLLFSVWRLVAAVHYVDANSASPVPPYLTWATAAATIQDAVDASSSGDEVAVTNGVYASGGRAIVGTMTNRVAITNALVVHSVNGPQFTSIQGYQLPGVIYGDGAIRCAYIASNALLHGFTLTGGATHSTGDFSSQRGGGGVWSAGGVVSNCVLSGNAAHASGGGGIFGTFNNCTFISNSVVNFPTNGGGGVAYAQLNNCTLSANQAPNGGGAFWGTLTNCTLTGNSATNGGGAYQAALTNCTLSGNSATNGGGTYGVFVTAVNCTFATNSSPNGGGANLGELIYCTLTGNWSTDVGGGAVGASLSSCLLVGNSATNGGGVYSCGLTNCTLSGNFAINGGGANSATLKNSIIYFNHGGSGIEYSACTLDYCCTTPQPASGSGNIASDPLFVDAAAGNFHLRTNSPCINAGNNAYLASSMDLDGNPRIAAGIIDVGAYEFQGPVAPSILAQPTEQTTFVGSNATFTVSAVGSTPLSYQWNHNGTSLNGATNSSLTLTNVQPSQAGNYAVTITNVAGSILSSNAVLTIYPPGTRFVDAASANPTVPYTNWAIAAQNIQDAIDVAVPGDEIVVTNGTYAGGGRAVVGLMTNRAAVYKPLFVHSVNGAQFTIIQGYQLPSAIKGDGAIRCVYLTNGSTLAGFTLTNGATRAAGDSTQQSGGGAWSESGGALSNCIIVANSAVNGGGAEGGTVNNCTLQGNSASGGGGADSASLNNCLIRSNSAYSGGGAGYCSMNNCQLIGNVASNGSGGGAALPFSMNNCLVMGNSANGPGSEGGGIWVGSLLSVSVNNCTVAGNSAVYGGGVWAVTNVSINNCIIYFNTAATGSNYSNFDFASGNFLNYCCTAPQPAAGQGQAIITSDPLFVNLAASNLRLQSNSPCINAGNNSYVTTSRDLDGHPRVIGGTVDMGAYEFVPAVSMRIARASPNITLAWPLWASNFVAQQADALPTNSSAWSNVAATVSQTVSENVVNVPSTNSAKFFRLFLP